MATANEPQSQRSARSLSGRGFAGKSLLVALLATAALAGVWLAKRGHGEPGPGAVSFAAPEPSLASCRAKGGRNQRFLRGQR
jgi:hypothetical protein